MLLEIGEERLPHLGEHGSPGLGLHGDALALRLVEIVELAIPRHHRIAVYHLVDAEREHELHPAVEHLVVVTPRAVLAAGPLDHVRVSVVTLVVPRILVQRGGHHFLSRVGKHGHEGFHSLEVGVAPHLETLCASHRRGVLPQIEVVVPIFGRGESSVLHHQREGQTHLAATVAGRHDLRAVYSRRGVARHLDRHPHGTRGARCHIESRQRIEHVGREDARTADGEEAVGYRVTHEAGAGYRCGQRGRVGTEIVHAALHAVGAVRRPEHDLGRGALAFPCRDLELFAVEDSGHLAARIAQVGIAPCAVKTLAGVVPSRFGLGREGCGVIGFGEGDDGFARAAARRGYDSCRNGCRNCKKFGQIHNPLILFGLKKSPLDSASADIAYCYKYKHNSAIVGLRGR